MLSPRQQVELASRAQRLWLWLSAAALGLALVAGIFATRCSQNVLGSVALVAGLYGASFIAGRGCSRILVTRTSTSPLLLGLAIPMGTTGLLSIGGLIAFRGTGYMDYSIEHACAAQIGMGMLFVAGTVWGLVVWRWRRVVINNNR